MEDYPRMLLNMLSNLHQYHLRYSNQLHGSAMAINLSSTILKFSRFLVKKIYFAIYTSPCVNMSVSISSLLFGKKSDSSYFTTNVMN